MGGTADAVAEIIEERYRVMDDSAHKGDEAAYRLADSIKDADGSCLEVGQHLVDERKTRDSAAGKLVKGTERR